MLATLLCVGCREGAPVHTPTEAPGPPSGMPVFERRTLSISDADLAEDGYWPLGVSDEGRIVYVASKAEAPMFRVLDSTGRKLDAFGRLGDGPGEFRSPLGLQVRGDSIQIFDDGRMTHLRYSWEGRPLGEVRSLILDIPLAWLADSLDHWVPPGMTRTERSVLRRTQIGDSAGRTLIAENDSGFQQILRATPGGRRLMRLSYAVGPSQIYLADAFNYQIYRYDSTGRLLTRFGRPLGPHHRGPKEISKLRRMITGRGNPPASGRAWLDTLDRDVTEHFNPSGFQLDKVGRLWIVGLANDSTTIDVFSDTTFLGRAVVPCFLVQGGSPVAISTHWLLLECELHDSADLTSELQLYRIVQTRRPPYGR